MSDVKVTYPHRERLISRLHEAAQHAHQLAGIHAYPEIEDLRRAATDFAEAELAFAHGVSAARTPAFEAPPKTNTTLTRAA